MAKVTSEGITLKILWVIMVFFMILLYRDSALSSAWGITIFAVAVAMEVVLTYKIINRERKRFKRRQASTNNESLKTPKETKNATTSIEWATGETQYFKANPVKPETIEKIKAEKSKGWAPMRWIAYKEIVIALLVIYKVTNWNHGYDTGGNFGMTVGLVMYAFYIGLVFNFFAISKSAKKLWQIALVICSILLNGYILYFWHLG